tara:strand:- start:5520 stop:7193 length:1674 start_codon:yes stop_codon:yes gene_type:complete
MITLGICNDETASACLFENGNLIAAASEERFSRKKLDNSFPFKSIEYVLSCSSHDIDNINVAYSWTKGFDPEILKYYMKRFSECETEEERSILQERIDYDISRDESNKNEFFDWYSGDSLNHYYHHESHAASACLLSSFDDGICLTADGRGDFESLVIWKFDRSNKEKPFKRLFSVTSSDSLGYFYGRITGLLGFKPMRHEGKITGLAAYGDPHKALSLMEDMITFNDGNLKGKLGELYRPFFKPYSDRLVNEIKKFSREDIAAAAQHHLEKILCDVLTYVLSQNNIKSTNLMLAGGIFGNVKVTQKLKELPIIKSVFVQPHMGDGGLCIGAAALSQHQSGIQIKPLQNVYLGPSIDLNSFVNDKKYSHLNIERCDDCYDNICSDLLDNKVIGLVRGRMEFGPRALCHRSIIYRTSDVTINDWINKRLNRTEFMPFAPVIRKELAEKSFINYKEDDRTLEFMTSTIDCTDEFAKISPAVTHVDQTARPQIVSKEIEPFIWGLLKKWEKISGEFSLVNTSFNAHEEPIICTYQEALHALEKNRVDIVYIENYRITNYV